MMMQMLLQNQQAEDRRHDENMKRQDQNRADQWERTLISGSFSKFSGNRADFSSWRKEIEGRLVHDGQAVSESIKQQHLMACLDGKARTQLTRAPEKHRLSYNSSMQFLTDRFLDLALDTKCRLGFYSQKQRPGQSNAEFALQLEAMCPIDKSHDTYDEMLIGVLVQGLLSDTDKKNAGLAVVKHRTFKDQLTKYQQYEHCSDALGLNEGQVAKSSGRYQQMQKSTEVMWCDKCKTNTHTTENCYSKVRSQPEVRRMLMVQREQVEPEPAQPGYADQAYYQQYYEQEEQQIGQEYRMAEPQQEYVQEQDCEQVFAEASLQQFDEHYDLYDGATEVQDQPVMTMGSVTVVQDQVHEGQPMLKTVVSDKEQVTDTSGTAQGEEVQTNSQQQDRIRWIQCLRWHKAELAKRNELWNSGSAMEGDGETAAVDTGIVCRLCEGVGHRSYGCRRTGILRVRMSQGASRSAHPVIFARGKGTVCAPSDGNKTVGIEVNRENQSSQSDKSPSQISQSGKCSNQMSQGGECQNLKGQSEQSQSQESQSQARQNQSGQSIRRASQICKSRSHAKRLGQAKKCQSGQKGRCEKRASRRKRAKMRIRRTSSGRCEIRASRRKRAKMRIRKTSGNTSQKSSKGAEITRADLSNVPDKWCKNNAATTNVTSAGDRAKRKQKKYAAAMDDRGDRDKFSSEQAFVRSQGQ